MEENIQNNPQFSQTEADETIDLKAYFALFISRWPWFVASVLIALIAAKLYLLSTPKEYTRSATLLIKEDSKSQVLGGDASNLFSGMGMSFGQSNVHNEVNTLRAPAHIYEVVRRLALDVDYRVPGTFHKSVIYGSQLPVRILFHDLNEKENATLTLTVKDNESVVLSEFKSSLREDLPKDEVVAILNDTLQTPLGKVTISRTDALSDFLKQEERTIYVTRTNLYSSVDHVLNNLSTALTDTKSTMIDITYQDENTERAIDVINTLIEVYKEAWLEDKNQATIATSNFITARLATLERELGGVDERISSFKSEHRLPNIEEASTLYLQQAKETDSQLLKLHTRQSMAQYVRGYLTEGAQSNQLIPANTGIESPGIEAQISEYNSAQIERNTLVANSSEQNPLVEDYDKTLAALRKAILTSVDNLLLNLNTEIKSLQAEQRRTNSQLASSPDQAMHLQAIGREQTVKEALYIFLLQKREENELSQAFTAYNIRLISAPSGSLKPVAPKSAIVMLAAFILGLLIPMMVLIIREMTNTTVRGRKDLEGLSMPFLGEIPSMDDKKKGLFRKKDIEEKEQVLIVQEGARDAINEAFRVVRTNLQFVSDSSRDTNVVMFTSYNVNSGKTFVAMNLAASFALKGEKVLVIDGDLRKGSLSKYINSPRPGWSDFLGGKVNDLNSIIQRGKLFDTLDVIPAGTTPPNPSELLTGDRLKETIEALQGQYDYVFIDCPPVEMIADTHIIAQYVDRTIFVVRAGLLERSMLGELQKLYDRKMLKNLSVLLNDTEYATGTYGKRYGYGYGYGYGYHQ